MPRRASRQPDNDPDRQVQIVIRIPASLYNRMWDRAAPQKRTIGAEAARTIMEADYILDLFGRSAIIKTEALGPTFAKALSLSDELHDPTPFAITLATVTADIWARGPNPTDPTAKDILAAALQTKLGYDNPPRATTQAAIRGEQAATKAGVEI